MAVTNKELEQILRAQNDMLLGLYRHGLGNGWLTLDEYVNLAVPTMDRLPLDGLANELTKPWYDLADQHHRILP